MTNVVEDGTTLYFSTDDGHIIYYNKKSLAFSLQKISDGRINQILRSKRAAVLYAITSNGKVISLNLATYKTSIAQYGTQNLHSVYEDSRGALWLEPQDSGVIRLLT